MPLAPTWDVTQRWHTNRDGSASLTVITVARGHEAPALRRGIERKTQKDLERSWRERRMEDLDVELTMTGLEWNDDVEAETFTLTERYDVDRFYAANEKHRFSTTTIRSDLARLPDAPRTRPFAVEAPVHVHERIEWTNFQPLVASNFTLRDEVVESDVFVLRSQQAVREGRLVLEWTLMNRASRVEPEAFEAHRLATRRAYDTTGYTVNSRHRDSAVEYTATKEHELFNLVGIGMLVVVAMVIVTWFGKASERWDAMKSRVRLDRFLSLHKGGDGELASRPAVLSSPSDAAKLFTSKSCPHGHTWQAPEESDGVRLGDERVTVMTRRCSTCDANEHRYVKLRG